MSHRAGTYIRQPTGYRAFVPAPLPPHPEVALHPPVLLLLGEADRALGRLDGMAENLPDVNLFVSMYVRKEAVLSSQIEGTQASLADILQFEADAPRRELPGDVAEVYQYVRAMNFGLKRMQKLPLSLRLICEIHGELMRGARGGGKTPGEFRRSQNWIGPERSTLLTARFIPPPPHEMKEALGDVERFIHSSGLAPALVKCALVHSQFETIHPFLDGNGRVGRLLITFMLCAEGILKRPLLYLSLFLKQRREEYYRRLMDVREKGDWEGWTEFFLLGVRDVSLQATALARMILDLQRRHRTLVEARVPGSIAGMRLLGLLFEHPVISPAQAVRALGVSAPTAYHLLDQFEKLRLVQELTGKQRNRYFSYQPYLDLFDQIEKQPVSRG